MARCHIDRQILTQADCDPDSTLNRIPGTGRDLGQHALNNCIGGRLSPPVFAFGSRGFRCGTEADAVVVAALPGVRAESDVAEARPGCHDAFPEGELSVGVLRIGGD